MSAATTYYSVYTDKITTEPFTELKLKRSKFLSNNNFIAVDVKHNIHNNLLKILKNIDIDLIKVACDIIIYEFVYIICFIITSND